MGARVILGSVDAMNLTQRREGAKGAKMRLLRCNSRFFYPVIPAKAGIQTTATKFAIRNQVQIAVSGSLRPLWEKARMRALRAQARLCGRDARAPRTTNLPM